MLGRRMRIARVVLKAVVFVSILESPVKLAIRQATPKPEPGRWRARGRWWSSSTTGRSARGRSATSSAGVSW
ncbi:hypothetical protein [Nannocystis pusilla]|uniref:hypothetical protein n=1 Tax=Nannocystis pusilla TaxID=889268 RepID=UPI003B808F9C